VTSITVAPVGAGSVAGLPRAGGNIDRFINIESPVGGKWIEMIKEIAPHIRRAAAMYNPHTAPYKYFEGAFLGAAQSMKVEPTPISKRRSLLSGGNGPASLSSRIVSWVLTARRRLRRQYVTRCCQFLMCRFFRGKAS
jgi:hypothetical protein